jgi:hypothetical protein
MEIEFNTGRIPSVESSPSTAKRGSTRAAADAVSFSTSNALKEQLANIPTVRPEQVAKGKELVADGKYPPSDVLDRIAVLLAIHSKNEMGGQSGPTR